MPLYKGRVKASVDYTVSANNEDDATELIIEMAENELASNVELETIEEV